MRETTVWLLVATYVVSLGLGWALQRGQRSLGARLLAALVPVALATFGCVALGEFFLSCSRDWNDVRLGPAAGFVRGFDLYYAGGEGPLLGNIYGPLSAVMYAPAALLSTPEAIVSAAALMTMLFFYGPALAILFVEARRLRVTALPTAACLASFVLFSLHTTGLADAGFWIHADAPALAFLATGCGILYLRRKPSIATSVLSALAAMLAVLTKQVALPVALMLPVCCWLLEGRAAFRSYLACWLAVGALLSGVVLATIDFDAMFFNAMVVPRAHPWQLTGMQLIATVASELARATVLPVVVIVLYAVAGRPAADASPESTGLIAHLRRERWWMWMLVALCMVPMSVLGRAVVGGESNALTYTLYLPAVAMHLVLLRTLAPRAEGGEGADARNLEWPRVALAALLALFTLEAAPRVVSVPAARETFASNEERVGFAFAEKYPGQVYFPANPLFPLAAHGKAQHCSSGVYDRYLAGVEMTNEYLAEYLPEEIRWIVYPNEADFSMNYLQAFSERVELPELPGWTVLQLPASMRQR